MGVCSRCGRTKLILPRGMCESCRVEQIEELAVKEVLEYRRDLAGERFTQAIRLVLGDDVPELSSTGLGA